MLEGRVFVSYCLEEVNLVFGEEERGGDGVHGRVAPTLIVEVAGLVEVVEEGEVVRRAEEVEVGDLEVGPDFMMETDKQKETWKKGENYIQWQRL